MSEGGRFITNDPVSAAVAAALAGIERDMRWVKSSLVDGKDAFRQQAETISQLKEVATKLTYAVEKLTDEQKNVSDLRERVIRAEDALRDIQADCADNTNFRKSILKYMAIAGLLYFLGDKAATKLLALLGVSL